jgi:putative nucleotidyltransferase with HDIG domain
MNETIVGDVDFLERVSEALAHALYHRDEYTHSHSSRVADLLTALGRKCGVKPGELDMLRACARFHDIGKIGIPDRILYKPGPLTGEELDIIKRHSRIGATIMSRVNVPHIEDYVDVILHHHERMDGAGYPDGLVGDDICLGARIIAIADAYDAMVSRRAYSDGLPHDVALQVMRDETGSHFDPRLAEAFFRVVD